MINSFLSNGSGQKSDDAREIGKTERVSGRISAFEYADFE